MKPSPVSGYLVKIPTNGTWVEVNGTKSYIGRVIFFYNHGYAGVRSFFLCLYMYIWSLAFDSSTIVNETYIIASRQNLKLGQNQER